MIFYGKNSGVWLLQIEDVVVSLLFSVLSDRGISETDLGKNNGMLHSYIMAFPLFPPILNFFSNLEDAKTMTSRATSPVIISRKSVYATTILHLRCP
jgi:hypothetical protein